MRILVAIVILLPAGAVYPATKSPSRTTESWSSAGNNAEKAQFGYSLASAGDINGDGYADVIVGAPRIDILSSPTAEDAGRAYLYYGASAGLPSVPSATLSGDSQAGAHFGWSVAEAGDIDADGFSDIVVGAPHFDTPATDGGRIYVFYGSSSGIISTPAWAASSTIAGTLLGYSVAAVDLNNDGRSDIIAGAPGDESEKGRVAIYLAGASGMPSTPSATLAGELAGSQFGFSVAHAGDVNKDGYADILVGAPTYGSGKPGKAYLYHGSSTGPTLAWNSSGDNQTASDSANPAQFGISVASAGDVNGDGYSDIAVGAHGYNNTKTDSGKVYVYYGSASGASPAPNWTSSGDDGDFSYFGVSVASAGDANGDGFADLIVGAHGQGKVFLYAGSSSGLGTSSTSTWSHSGERFGRQVARAGDVNKDGSPDLLFGAPYAPSNETGRAYVYFGAPPAVPNAAPTIANPTPATGTWMTTATPTLSATVTAPESGQSAYAEFSVDGGPYLAGSAVTGGGGSAFTTPPLAQGPHTWVARARDAFGSLSGPTQFMGIKVDTIAPTLGTPNASPLVSNNGFVAISWNAWDTGSGVAKIRVLRSDSGAAFTAVATLAGTSSSWSQSPALPDGSYVYRIVATDAAGNSTTKDAPPVVVDTVAPTAPTLVSPANGSSLFSSSVPLDWSDVTDPSGVRYEVHIEPVAPFYYEVFLESGLTSSQVTFSSLPSGSYYWRVYAIDGAGNASPYSAIGTFTIVTENTPPPISSTAPILSPYRAQIAPTDGNGALLYRISSGTLPFGLSLSPLTGWITGVPTLPGTYPFAVRVDDPTGIVASYNYILTVIGVPTPLTFLSPRPLPRASRSLAYAHLFRAQGGVHPRSWSVIAGSLPPGLHLSPAGLLWGTPTAEGAFAFTIRITDGMDMAATETVTMTIQPYSAALGIASSYPSLEGMTQFPLLVTGTEFSSSLFAPAAVEWELTSGLLPPGLVLAGGRIMGRASTPGVYSFVVQATDGFGQSAYLGATICVAANGGEGARILPCETPTGSVGQGYSMTLIAAGGIGVYEWSTVSGSLPPGLALDAQTGEILGAPVTAGVWTVILEATDGRTGSSMELTFVIRGSASTNSGDGGGEGGGSCGCLGIEAVFVLGLLGWLRRWRGSCRGSA